MLSVGTYHLRLESAIHYVLCSLSCCKFRNIVTYTRVCYRKPCKLYEVYIARCFHYWHCSRICRRVNNIHPTTDSRTYYVFPARYSFPGPDRSLRSIGSKAVSILFRSTLLNTLLTVLGSLSSVCRCLGFLTLALYR